MELLAENLSQLHWPEIFAVVFGILYVLLAARESVWCWFWGILSCSLWAYTAFAIYDLYMDALLQVFYIGISGFGIYEWLYGSEDKSALPIARLSFRNHFIILFGGAVVSVVGGYFFDNYTAAAATYLDAFTTVFSIIATFMVVRKILENWIYWIVIDAVYIYLYSSRGSILFTALFVVYLIIAIAGWWRWRKSFELQAKV